MSSKKEELEKTQKAFESFFSLVKYLFADDAPYDVNEIPEDSPFHEDAKAISEEMGLDWEKMSHDDSNRVMLNILSDYYHAIEPNEGYEAVLTVSFKKKA